MNGEASSSPADIRLRDPLSEVTRKERRLLLGISALGIVIVKSGLVPSKVEALGIQFTQTNQQALILALGAVIGYFLVAFVLYAASDLTAWRTAFHSLALDRYWQGSTERGMAASYRVQAEEDEGRVSRYRRDAEADEKWAEKYLAQAEPGEEGDELRELAEEKKKSADVSRKQAEQAKEQAAEHRKRAEAEQKVEDSYRRRQERWLGFVAPVSFFRAVFEFVIPVMIGIYAMVLLFTASPPPIPTA
jgi:hypothetical protein